MEGYAGFNKEFDGFFYAAAIAAPAVVGDVLTEGSELFLEEVFAHFVLDLPEAAGEAAADDGFDVLDAVVREDVGADLFGSFSKIVVCYVGC